MKSTSKAKKQLEILNCAKNVHLQKFTKYKEDRYLWWKRKFDDLENKSKIPDYKRIESLRNIFLDEEIEKLENSGVEVIDHENSSGGDGRYIKNFTHLRSKKPQEYESSKRFIGKSCKKLFMDFMNKPKEDASCWHVKKELETQDLPIIERAERIKKQMVQQFVDKFDTIAKSEEINDYTVLSIYEIISPFPISKALNINPQLLGVMPERTVKYLGCLEKSKIKKLLKEIYKDIKASKKPPKKIAFGKNLPPEMRRIPSKENLGFKWVTANAAYENIESFANVWKDITDLESTRKFCMYLLEHPEVKPPPFLLKEGLLLKNILKKPVYLGNLAKQYENVNFADFMNFQNLHRSKYTITKPRKLHRRSLSDASAGEISDINVMI